MGGIEKGTDKARGFGIRINHFDTFVSLGRAPFETVVFIKLTNAAFKAQAYLRLR